MLLKYWPQLTYILMFIIGLLFSLMNHGKDQGKYSFWTALISVVISSVILYFGGFWEGLF